MGSKTMTPRVGLWNAILQIRARYNWRHWLRPLIIGGVLLLSALVGYRPRVSPLLLATGLAGLLLALLTLRSMPLALTLLIAASATINFSLSTGTQSPVHISLILVAVYAAIWVIRMIVERRTRLAPNPANLPLLLFNVAMLLSWISGYAFWKTTVPRPDNALVVQAGQVAMFVLSTTAFFLTANHPVPEKTLRLWNVLIIALGLAALVQRLVPVGPRLSGVTGSMLMWPFVLLWAQLLFNTRLRRGHRVLGWISLPLWGYWTWASAYTWKSGWVPALLALAILLALRYRKLVVPTVLAGIVIIVLISLPSTQTAPQEQFLDPNSVGAVVWSSLALPEQASGSFQRLPIWYDVLRMTTHSPILGLGPANYMYYWRDPAFASYSLADSPNWWAWFAYSYTPPSHNMFVDVLAQGGLLGLGLFLWACASLVHVVNRARLPLPTGFLGAYAHGVLAGFVALLAASFFFADWLIPFVYNITIKGFQHSVYSWLLLGSIVPLLRDGRPDDANPSNP